MFDGDIKHAIGVSDYSSLTHQRWLKEEDSQKRLMIRLSPIHCSMVDDHWPSKYGLQLK